MQSDHVKKDISVILLSLTQTNHFYHMGHNYVCTNSDQSSMAYKVQNVQCKCKEYHGIIMLKTKTLLE